MAGRRQTDEKGPTRSPTQRPHHTRPHATVGWAILAVTRAATASGASCQMGAGWLAEWVVPFTKQGPGHNETTLILSHATAYGDGNFSLYMPTRGLAKAGGVYPGRVFPNNTLVVAVSPHDGPNFTKTGVFTEGCQRIMWADNRSSGPSWCAAWTTGCDSPPPPYGMGFSFWSVFSSNMVLQSAPPKAAVYGIAVGPAPMVEVTVMGGGETYVVQADINTTHQPFGPEYVNHECDDCNYPGPFTSWKAFLKPSAPGGNFTIIARCTSGCTETGQYDHANITNVTFGDVWHCSGQSNMALQLYHTFSRNDTLRNITKVGRYRNIRLMTGIASGTDKANNPWLTALQATASLIRVEHIQEPIPPLFMFSAACWYFAQKLTDELEKSGKVIPIGLVDTAVGGQRIEEYMRNNSGMTVCSNRSDNGQNWATGHFGRPDGVLFGAMVLPYVDMSTKGWLWYQGENNMGGVKGSSAHDVGYSCEIVQLVKGWREAFSETPGTTDPVAPFGIVTLASSGSEGGPNMGAMRLAQTAGYGIVPNADLPNTFFAQAYDLDDAWGPEGGPCFGTWACCGKGANVTTCKNATNGKPEVCALACAVANDTRSMMGGIHPRNKKPLGDRLGAAAFAEVYGGSNAATGPTLSSCRVDGKSLIIEFNETLLHGDTLVVSSNFPAVVPPHGRGSHLSGGTQLYAQIDPELFCLEPLPVLNTTTGRPISPTEYYCPEWGGGRNGLSPGLPYDGNWTMLNFTQASPTSITVDLSALNGSSPTAVRYAWGIVDCCDHTDPTLYVTHGCIAACPIMSTSGLPANPFSAKIVGGVCQCVLPQVC